MALQVDASHPSSKGIESARLEAIRKAVRGLKKAQKSCLEEQQKSERRVADVLSELEALR